MKLKDRPCLRSVKVRMREPEDRQGCTGGWCHFRQLRVDLTQHCCEEKHAEYRDYAVGDSWAFGQVLRLPMIGFVSW